MTERWRGAPGYDGYEVSDLGRVRSWRRSSCGRILKQALRNGYWIVNLQRGASEQRTEYVHRLVLGAFKGPPPEGCEARHLDGDRQHCRLTNLRWGTRVENSADKRAHGRRPVGSANSFAKLTEEDVVMIRASPFGSSALADMLGVSTGAVENVRRRTTWKHL